MGATIHFYKRKLGVGSIQHYTTIKNEEKITLVERWDKSYQKEKEKMVKEYNTTYINMKSRISKYRKICGMDMKEKIFRTTEEKIKMIERFNSSRLERHKMCKELNISSILLKLMITRFKIELNITDKANRGLSDKEIKCLLEAWENSTKEEKEELAKEYLYKNVGSMIPAISRWKKLKGLV